ncbi:MAG TPA: hypothetical protein VFZ08_12515 [Terriglobia bacterium]|nr:hypothetical protein [Terriglobia bacterium]
MKKFTLITLTAALALLVGIIPLSGAPAFAGSSPSPSWQAGQQPGTPGTFPQQTQPQPQQQERQQREQQQQMEQQQQQEAQQQQNSKKLHMMTGTIEQHGKHYVFVDESTSATYKIANQSKVKHFKGEKVKIVGKVNTAKNTIHVAGIQRVS